MKNKYIWNPIEEMDDEITGDCTCYSASTGRKDKPFVWLTEFPDGWHVETKRADEDDFRCLKVCKTLSSAKRWASSNLLNTVWW